MRGVPAELAQPAFERERPMPVAPLRVTPAALILCSSAHVALADSLAWDGDVSDLWSATTLSPGIGLVTNWSTDALPGMSDDVIIGPEAGPVRILLMDAQAGSLLVQSSLTVSRRLTVGSSAVLNDALFDIPGVGASQTISAGTVLRTTGQSVWRDAVIADTPLWVAEGSLQIGDAGNNILSNTRLESTGTVVQTQALHLTNGSVAQPLGLWRLTDNNADITSDGAGSYLDLTGGGTVVVDMDQPGFGARFERVVFAGAGGSLIDVQRGTLTIDRAEVTPGTRIDGFSGLDAVVQQGAALRLLAPAGQERLYAGRTGITGSGTVEISGPGTARFETLVNRLTGGGVLRVSNGATIAGTGAAGVTFSNPAGARMEVISSTIGGILLNEGDLVLDGARIASTTQNVAGGAAEVRSTLTLDGAGLGAGASLTLRDALITGSGGLTTTGGGMTTVEQEGARGGGSVIAVPATLASLDVRSGTLGLTDRLTVHSGSQWSIASGAAVQLATPFDPAQAGPGTALRGDVDVVGAGRLVIDAGTIVGLEGSGTARLDVDLGGGFVVRGDLISPGLGVVSRGVTELAGPTIELPDVDPDSDGPQPRVGGLTVTGMTEVTGTTRVVGSTLRNEGEMDVRSAVLFLDGGRLVNTGSIDLRSGMSALGSGSAFLNDGVLTGLAGARVAVPFTNTPGGTVRVDSGRTLLFDTDVTNISDAGVLDAGTWVVPVGATLDTPLNAEITALAGNATVILGGTWNQLALTRNAGTLVLDDPTNPTVSYESQGDFFNEGTIGTVLDDLGVNVVPSRGGDAFDFSGGLRLGGFRLTSDGRLEAGGKDDIGYFGLEGDLTLGEAGSIGVELGVGDASGLAADRYVVAGSAMVDGVLDVALLGGFVPSASLVFEILASRDGVSGAFTNVSADGRVLTRDGLGSFAVTTDGQRVFLSSYAAIPSPGGIGVGLFALVACARRRRP